MSTSTVTTNNGHVTGIDHLSKEFCPARFSFLVPPMIGIFWFDRDKKVSTLGVVWGKICMHGMPPFVTD